MTLAVEIEAADPDPEPVSLRGASPPGVGAGGSSYAIVPESGAEAKKCRLVEQDRLTFFLLEMFLYSTYSPYQGCEKERQEGAAHYCS